MTSILLMVMALLNYHQIVNPDFNYVISTNGIEITHYAGSDYKGIFALSTRGGSCSLNPDYILLEEIRIPVDFGFLEKTTSRDFSTKTDLTIPSGVTKIGSDAFCLTPSIKTVHFPDSLTEIGEGAFACCESLTEVTITKNITGIGPGAFCGNPSLTSITVAEENPCYKSVNGVLYSKNGDVLIQVPTGIDAEEFVIPDGVTEIGEEAFAGCAQLKRILIPESVTTIKHGAFSGCRSLTAIQIPESVTEIGWGAFIRCSALTEIRIPEKVQELGTGMFIGCSSLERVELPKKMTMIESSAFDGCSSLTQVEIPDGVTEISPCAFHGCSALSELKIPDSVTTISLYAFHGCSNLTKLVIPSSVTQIVNDKDRTPFTKCPSLTIYGNKGSMTEQYANENGIAFVAQ